MKFSEFCKNREKQTVQEFHYPTQDSLHDLRNYETLTKLNNILGQLAYRGVINPSAMISTIQNFLALYGLSFKSSDLMLDLGAGIDKVFHLELRQFGGTVGYQQFYAATNHLDYSDGATRVEIPRTEISMNLLNSLNTRRLVLSVHQDPLSRLYFFTAKIQ